MPMVNDLNLWDEGLGIPGASDAIGKGNKLSSRIPLGHAEKESELCENWNEKDHFVIKGETGDNNYDCSTESNMDKTVLNLVSLMEASAAS